MMASKYQKWTQWQDQVLIDLVAKYGPKNWKLIAHEMKSDHHLDKRIPKQCRQRWLYHHSTTLNTQKWSNEESLQLLRIHALFGTKWVQISKYFKGRTDSCVKNHFFALTKKGLRHMSRYAHVKAEEINVYSIKPMTISTIFLCSQNKVILKKLNSNHYLQCLMQYSVQEIYQITKCIIQFALKKSDYSQLSDHQTRERIRQILETILLINQKIMQIKTQDYSKSSKSQQWQSMLSLSDSAPRPSLMKNEQLAPNKSAERKVLQSKLTINSENQIDSAKQIPEVTPNAIDTEENWQNDKNIYFYEQSLLSQKLIVENQIEKINEYRNLDNFYLEHIGNKYEINTHYTLRLKREQSNTDDPFENYDQMMNQLQVQYSTNEEIDPISKYFTMNKQRNTQFQSFNIKVHDFL